MRYRLDENRRRNLLAQHGELPSDDDVFVALFEDPLVAERVALLLNMQESMRTVSTPRTPKEQQDLLAGKASEPGHEPLPQRKMQDRDNPMCKCGHRASVHAADGLGHCMSADPDDNCVAFEARKPAPVNVPLTPSDQCTCGHLYWEHAAVAGQCTLACRCRVFTRRCSTHIGQWTNRCTLAAGHTVPHLGNDGRGFSSPYTQGSDK